MVMGTGTERERERGWRRASERTMGTETGDDGVAKRSGIRWHTKGDGNEDECFSRTGRMRKVVDCLQTKPTGSSVVTVEAKSHVTPGKKTNNSP